jgi:O-antigen/teichoic acid export membrane protein
MRRNATQQHTQVHIPNHQQWISHILVFSWPFMAGNVFGWAQQSSGRWALEMYATTENVGLFSVLSQIGYAPLQIIIGLVVSFITPILFARTGDASSSVRNSNVRKLTNKLAMMGLGLTGCAFVVTILWHSFIFQQLVGSEYFLVSHLLPWIVLSGGIFGVAQIYAIRLQSLLIMNRLVFSGIAISLFGVFLSVTGALIYGLVGVVFGSLIFSATYLISMWYWFFIKT